MYKPGFLKREVIVFRQFKRKGWALFACLGREVVISVLSVATLSSTKAACISNMMWRTDTAQVPKEIWLGDVGVTGSRAPLTQSQAARMVTVLSHDDIAQAAVQSVNDLLKLAVGIDVRQRGALGSQTDISIRGGTQEQITVLLNGINICDPQTGHNVMDLPCQLDEIVRVEVLEGPAGRAYGTSSLVGGINIVTSSGDNYMADGNGRKLKSDIIVEGGSFGYAKAAHITNLSIHSQSSFTFNQQLSSSYQRSDGFSRSKAGKLNTDYSGLKAFYQGKFGNKQMTVRWHAGISDKGWGSGTFYATPRWQADDQYEHTTKIFTALQANTKLWIINIRPSIYWNQYRDRYEGYRNRPDLMKFNHNKTNIYGINLNSYFDWKAGRTAIGAEIRNEDLVSGNLGEPLSSSEQDAQGTASKYSRGINRTNLSAHIEHNVLLRRLTLSAGVIAAKNTWSNADWKLFPGIDVSYLLYESDHSPLSIKLFASYNTSLRLPSFTEMYYKLQGYAADPHLKPEEMQALEAGAQLSSPTLMAKATVWHHQGRNIIDWMMDTHQGDVAEWQSVNHTRINATGFEMSANINLQQLFSSSLSTSSDFPSIRLSYSYISQDKDLEEGFVSQYALEYLRHKLVATLHTPLWRHLSMTLNTRWQDREGQYTTFNGDVCDYRPFALADARLQWQTPLCTLYAEVNNLFDNRHYVDYGNVPQPGIWFVGGVKYRLPF
ncbi:MAG: TonB-dependent receptor [Prevotella sp.]|nr:TonB-dependent receptor [Prevotella sp.]